MTASYSATPPRAALYLRVSTARQAEHDVSIPDQKRQALRAARNYRKLRALGITIRKTADVIIGTFCIEHGHALLHDDRYFAPMEEHLGLLVV